MRSNGWIRLWVMSTMIWLCVVVFFTWQKWPLPETTPHNRDFLSLVKPQNALLNCPSTISTKKCEESAAVIVEMPNGYRLLLSVPDSDPNAQAAAKSYWDVVELASKNKTKSLLVSAGLIWLCSALAVLLLGVGVVWVNRGFRSTP